jgi:tetratricopeptide (TPR) repeat protein
VKGEFIMSNFVELSSELEFLVIDESVSFRESLAQILKTIGFKKVTLSGDGLSALKILKEKKIGFVICEKNLKQMSGIELLREIRETPSIKRVPFMMMCVDIPKEDVVLASEFGIDAYLKKPFAVKEISQKIATCMSRYKDEFNNEYLFECARENFARLDYNMALSFYQQLLQALPQSARVRVGMSRCYKASNDFNQAQESLSEAIKLNQLYVHAYHEMATLNLNLNKIEEALKLFEKAIELSPSNPYRYETIANILMGKGEFAKAEEYLLKAVKLDLVYPDLYSQLGKALFSQKKPEKAFKYFEKALEKEPDNTSFLNSVGICLKEMGRYEDSIFYYNKALKLKPKDTKILFNKVLVLCNMSEFEKAQKVLLQILKIDESYDKAKVKLQEVELQMKKTEKKA